MSLPKQKIKRIIIQRLQENLIIGHVCKQLSVARTTFYRWQREDEKFRKAVKSAQELGRAMLCDAATSKIVSIMNNGDNKDALQAAKMILNRYDPYYAKLGAGTNYKINKLKDQIELLKKEKDEIADKEIYLMNKLLEHAKSLPPTQTDENGIVYINEAN